MSRRDRQKASDVFRETEFVFARKGSFEEAFPEIDDVEIEVEESGRGVSEWYPSKRVYRKPYWPGEYIDCGNPLCYNGGFSIGSILRAMVWKKGTIAEGGKICQGYEGSPKGRRKYRDCVNVFKYRIRIKYKETSESQSDE